MSLDGHHLLPPCCWEQATASSLHSVKCRYYVIIRKIQLTSSISFPSSTILIEILFSIRRHTHKKRCFSFTLKDKMLNICAVLVMVLLKVGKGLDCLWFFFSIARKEVEISCHGESFNGGHLGFNAWCFKWLLYLPKYFL